MQHNWGSQISNVSAFHDLIQVVKLSDHPRVCDLMSGALNQIPKCTFIWDVEAVLEYFINLPEKNLLLDKTKTFKLVHCLALTPPSRASEMANLNLNYLSKSLPDYIFYPWKLTKTWCKVKAPHKPLKLYSLPGEKKLCVCATLDPYLSLHESFHQAISGFSQFCETSQRNDFIHCLKVVERRFGNGRNRYKDV